MAVLRPQSHLRLNSLRCSACPFQNLPRGLIPAGTWLVTVNPSGCVCGIISQFVKLVQNPY